MACTPSGRQVATGDRTAAQETYVRLSPLRYGVPEVPPRRIAEVGLRAATVVTEITKAVAAFTDTVAKDVFTVTIPNAAHAAMIEIDLLGVTGAGGAVGAGESTAVAKYTMTVVRTAGVAGVVVLATIFGDQEAGVAGADILTSVIATVSGMTGANGAEQTFTILAAITKSAGASDNHTLVATARILNGNASGITLA